MDTAQSTEDPAPRVGQPGLLSVRQVADGLRVSPMTVRRLIRRGELRAYALGATYRVTAEDLDAYLAGAAVDGGRA